MMINTRQVKDRRLLRFERLGDALGEAEQLAEAERRGAVRALGNWSLGQAIGHLAFWARAPFENYPGMGQAPWIVRLVVKPFKNRILNGSMPAGGRIPRAPGGTYGIEPRATDEALSELRAAYERLEREAPSVPNQLLGPLTHEQWKKLNLRHAELHLSFFAEGC